MRGFLQRIGTATLASLLLCGFASGTRASDLNEVGAILVFPVVTNLQGIICIPLGGGQDDCECAPPCTCFCDNACTCDCQDACGTDCETACENQCESECECECEEGCDPQARGDLVCFQSTFVETFLTITNAGPLPGVAHVSYVNGDESDPEYCYECDFDLYLTGNDTETLVVTSGPNGTQIDAEDAPLSLSCPWPYGMIVVSLEDGSGVTSTDNVLLGELVVVDYAIGTAFSIPAIPFQGQAGGNGDRSFAFDGHEYSKLPRVVAADFLAPRLNPALPSPGLLSLFTLDFERQFPPLVDCSVIGYDAGENPFSASFQFGCWGVRDLCAISPEFCHPNLGLYSSDSHGWLQLDCRVDRDPQLANGFDTQGGVHGALIQFQSPGSTIPAGSGSVFQQSAAWARLLYQSVTTGDAATLHLENPAPGLD